MPVTGDSGRVGARRRFPFAVRGVTITALVVVVVLVLGAVLNVWLLDRRLERLDVDLAGSSAGGTTYLIVGDDSRQHLPPGPTDAFGYLPGDRADLLLALRVPDDGSTPTVMSIPRDLLVLNHDFALQRLTLTWMDGPQATVDALCSSLGLGIDHLIRVRFDGFTSIVDDVGGVDVTLDAPIRDTLLGFDLPAGTLHLDGALALLYVRARHLERFDGNTWVTVPNQRGEQGRTVLEQVMRNLDLSAWNPIRTERVVWRLAGAVAVERGTNILGLRSLRSALSRMGEADELKLPTGDASGEDDPIPFVNLGRDASATLQRMGAGGQGCPRATLLDSSR